MKFWLWSVLLTAASVRHPDPEHRARLRTLAAELARLDRRPRLP